MNYETYYIPANFTDAGRLFGMFEIRNAIEAVLLGIPIILFCTYLVPLALMSKIIVTMVIVIPTSGFALIGIADESLTRYLRARIRWQRKKRILTYKGEDNYREFERFYLRAAGRRG